MSRRTGSGIRYANCNILRDVCHGIQVDIPGLVQEPFNYAEPVPSIIKFYIELRYSLMQNLYDAMFENLINGLPIARSMVLSLILSKVINL
jgi:hypothetical protein